MTKQAKATQRAHAELSASGSAMWMNCPGSIIASRGLPDKESDAAREGTVYHELMDLCLSNGTEPREYQGQIVVPKYPDLPVNAEMVGFAEEAILRVKELGATDMFVEERVDLTNWVPESFGTSDIILIATINGLRYLVVWDHKYGKGLKVDAKDNSQMMLYGLGAFEAIGWMDHFDMVRLIVDQPRLHHYDEWDITPDELLAWADGKVRPAAKLALTEGAPRIPGPRQCKWCKAKTTCRELAEHNLKLVMDDFEDLGLDVELDAPLNLKDRGSLTNEEIAFLLPQLDNVVSWVKALEAHAQSELESGRVVPGYKLVEGRTNRRWKDEDAAEKFLRRKLGAAGAYQPRKILTPSQAEKEVGKNDRLAELIVKPEGKPTIALASDKRPALDVAGDFDNLD